MTTCDELRGVISQIAEGIGASLAEFAEAVRQLAQAIAEIARQVIEALADLVGHVLTCRWCGSVLIRDKRGCCHNCGGPPDLAAWGCGDG